MLIGLRKKILLAVCTGFFSLNAIASDLGVLGKVYEIDEPDMVETIKEMLREKKASGELDKFHNDLVEKNKKNVRRPPGVILPRASEERMYAIDPTYTLDKDLKDADGNLLYPKGFTFNPLALKPLTKTLCFIDGDDPEQVEWLIKNCNDELKYKNILVNGDYIKVGQNVGSRIYFDQKGFLVKHFRIEAVPAVIKQVGGLLSVKEVSF